MARRLRQEHDELFTYYPRELKEAPKSLIEYAGRVVIVNGWYICKKTGFWKAYVREGNCLVYEDELDPFKDS